MFVWRKYLKYPEVSIVFFQGQEIIRCFSLWDLATSPHVIEMCWIQHDKSSTSTVLWAIWISQMSETYLHIHLAGFPPLNPMNSMSLTRFGYFANQCWAVFFAAGRMENVDDSICEGTNILPRGLENLRFAGPKIDAKECPVKKVWVALIHYLYAISLSTDSATMSQLFHHFPKGRDWDKNHLQQNQWL